MAILASIVVPRVVNRASDAKVTKAKSDINTLSQSLNQFRLDNDRYPSTEEGLQALRLQPADTNNWKGPYIEKDVPLDPWGNAYIYEFPGTAGPDSFTLMTYGSDGAPGGEGESADISEADL